MRVLASAYRWFLMVARRAGSVRVYDAAADMLAIATFLYWAVVVLLLEEVLGLSVGDHARAAVFIPGAFLTWLACRYLAGENGRIRAVLEDGPSAGRLAGAGFAAGAVLMVVVCLFVVAQSP